jgi:ATP-dependent RNA helicase DHX57
VFEPARSGELKVVVSTNVAEASVTIPDVTVVVDSCRVKEMDFDQERQMSALIMKFASQDSLRQRRGRAGRVKAGRCFRAVTKGTYEKLPANSVPEMLRAPLENLVLQVTSWSILAIIYVKFFVREICIFKVLSFFFHNSSQQRSLTHHTAQVKAMDLQEDCTQLLRRCPDPPSRVAIRAAERNLSQIQAIDADSGKISPLGRHLAELPCDPRVGRLLVYGALLGCAYQSSAIAACLSARSPFLTPNEPDARRKVDEAKVSSVAFHRQ